MKETEIFNNLTTVSEITEVFVKERNKLCELAPESDGIELMHSFSNITDALISRIFEIALNEVHGTSANHRRRALKNIAVASVGGYGRREMSPFSDVDVSFLVDHEEDDFVDPVIKKAFRTLMDVLDKAGVKVGYSYRRIDDVENLEFETQTALFDARCICGNTTVFNTFTSNLRRSISPCAFVIEHAKGRGIFAVDTRTPFIIEPNIKEGNGGLRDIHAARWTAQIAFNLDINSVWSGLRSKGILQDQEIESILNAVEFLSKVRNVLHTTTKIAQDVLVKSKHEELSRLLGLSSANEFMSLYYHHAHCIYRISRKVIKASIQQDLEVEPGIVAKNGLLRILDKGLFLRDDSSCNFLCSII